MPSFVYILLGSNQGNAIENLKTAALKLEEKLGMVVHSSSFYQTAAWGNTEQAPFINQVLLVQTKLPAETCLQINLEIETEMGRTRLQKWEPRIIDIDILYYNNEVIQLPQLTVPHPHMAERRFTLVPLAEIAPNFIHPVLGMNSKELLKNCADTLEVEKISVN
ncbi:MAG: 2-amino-4-hydroxy-6-hydroxymethyldihydropteridine diphosphokinase [Bacteroidota bacterium]|nr:2-amino-4-hydroxy-6-hydroxymethyldihydropteridine diphosphokinase [Bacteroidota bacterium]